jgi:hypothetical protein
MLPDGFSWLFALGYFYFEFGLCTHKLRRHTLFLLNVFSLVFKEKFIMGMCCLHKRGEEGVNRNGHVGLRFKK